MILFNRPAYVENAKSYMEELLSSANKLSGDGIFTKKCSSWMEQHFNTPKALMTTSCTHALEMSAMLCDIQPGDEIITTSYTFVSTVNAFVLRGAKIVFIDIRPDTMNIDEKLIEDAITKKTKAIVAVHYAGVSCEMDAIIDIAKRYGLFVIEDAAQGVMSSYKGQALGTIGDLGCYSFHDTKNYTMGEGGALLIQKKTLVEKAEIIREKGTNRSNFLRGQVDKYTWVDIGSSYLPSELNTAYLFGQLEQAEEINQDRLKNWDRYYKGLSDLQEKGFIELPTIPEDCVHNAHMFYIKCENLEVRSKLIQYLQQKGIMSAFHYIPLHSSKAGKEHGRFYGVDFYTTKESGRLLRLPLYYNLEKENVTYIVDQMLRFYLN